MVDVNYLNIFNAFQILCCYQIAFLGAKLNITFGFLGWGYLFRQATTNLTSQKVGEHSKSHFIGEKVFLDIFCGYKR